MRDCTYCFASWCLVHVGGVWGVDPALRSKSASAVHPDAPDTQDADAPDADVPDTDEPDSLDADVPDAMDSGTDTMDTGISTFIPAAHTYLAADGDKVFIGQSGSVREYQELDGSGGWVLVARYTSGGGSVACDADGDRLIVGVVPNVYVFGTTA